MGDGDTTRYAILGAGSRSGMYVAALTAAWSQQSTVVAVCDPNPGRADLRAREIETRGGGPATTHHPDDLEAMIDDRRVDTVVVTSPDFTHADLVARSVRAGADAIVEKPLATDAPGCAMIAEAVADTGRRVVATFNYRYSPRNTRLKELVAGGAIGEVTSVHFEWLLDTSHGADYFRRWHRDKANSGGLLVHKASHHFDLVNWWIDAAPIRVYATGGLRFYGADNARGRDLGPRPERGSTDAADNDPFLLDLRKDEDLAALYLDHEHHDGYLRDRDVFTSGITIEDNLNLVVQYDSGASMSYSLNAHAPWEGYTIGFNGTAGRAELTVVERGFVSADGAIDPSVVHEEHRDDVRPVHERLVLQPHWEHAREVEIPTGDGGHGGGDDRLLDDLFGDPAPDRLQRAADHRDGTWAAGVGIAGNRSLETGQPVDLSDLGLFGRQAEAVDR